MARPSSAFQLAWTSLSATKDEPGWQLIAIDPAGPVAVEAGRRFPGNEEAVLASFPKGSLPLAEKLPDGHGFVVERADPYGDGRFWLALARRLHGSAELFTEMACDVVGAMDAEAAAGGDAHRLQRVFLGRVRAWQEFMRKGAQTLSAEAEIGLLGELATLAGIIDTGVPLGTAVAAWVGPLDAPQDFELGTGAVEVKSTLAAIGFPARIGSLEQLDDSVRQPLFVAACRLKQLAQGRSLPEMVAALRFQVAPDAEANALFSERLIAAGYFDAHADGYARRFKPESIRLVEVTAAFPRLVQATIPLGVTKAIYELDLDKVPGTRLDITAAAKKLGAI
jgi:hypothetical protein